MPDLIELTLLLNEEPKRVFTAWMDPREHATFTGGGLATIEPWTGGRFTAFEGDVHGIFLGVDNAARIVQTWRTPEFPPESRDSRLTVTFEAAPGGTKLRIQHADVPPKLLRKLQKGWESNYLKPLSKYFVPGMKGSKKKAAKGTAPTAAAIVAPVKAAAVKAVAKVAIAPVKALVKATAKAAAATKPKAPAPAPSKTSAPKKAAPKPLPAKKAPAKKAAPARAPAKLSKKEKKAEKKAAKKLKNRGRK
jgi:uncharacterized protein YndB with AHSA1/START domain